MKRIRQIIQATAIAVFASVATTGFAATIESHPGVVAIDWGGYVGGREPTATVRISPTLLRFMTSMAGEAAAELAEIEGVQEIISQVRQIHVEVYEVDHFNFEAAIDANSVDAEFGFCSVAGTEISKLASAGWESVVRARETNERIDVMILPKDDQIVGIVIVAAEENELSFVNVAGDFDPVALGRHLGAIARLASEGEVDLEELLGEAVLADLMDKEHEEDHDDED